MNIMKKLMPVLLFVILSLGLNAQNFSIRGGVNLASLSGDDVVDTDNVTGYYVGPAFDLNLGVVNLDIALLYGRRGGKFSSTQSSVKLDYIDLPVLLKFNLGPIILEAGPYAAMLLNASNGGIDVGDMVDNADFGLMAIGGVALGDLVFELTYTKGLSDVWKDELINLKNGSFSFGLRYCF